jgi:hypothetical protein
MWKNIEERGRPRMVMWRMCVASSITNSTNTHSEYCFSAATVVARTHLSVTLYAHSLSILIFYTTCHILNLFHLNADYCQTLVSTCKSMTQCNDIPQMFLYRCENFKFCVGGFLISRITFLITNHLHINKNLGTVVLILWKRHSIACTLRLLIIIFLWILL